MPRTPEQKARENIDALLSAAGWIVQDRRAANPSAGRGVAVREFPMRSGYGEGDYLLYVDGMAVGVIEAQKEGSTLVGFELQPPGRDLLPRLQQVLERVHPRG